MSGMLVGIRCMACQEPLRYGVAEGETKCGCGTWDAPDDSEELLACSACGARVPWDSGNPMSLQEAAMAGVLPELCTACESRCGVPGWASDWLEEKKRALVDARRALT